MPLYPIEMHNGSECIRLFCFPRLIPVMKSLQQLGVIVVLGERVMTWPEHPEILDGNLKTLVTSAGRQLTAEMILPCTGQKPHVRLMASFRPQTISPITGRIRINLTLQVDNSLPGITETEDLSHIFACGDCAESGAIQAGHTAYWQGQQAAENVVKMIALKAGLAEGPLGEYKPTHPAIKVTLGRVS
jgi:NADH dehydrogenase FAD-containing subunit